MRNFEMRIENCRGKFVCPYVILKRKIMKKILALVALLAIGMTAMAQADWKKVEKLIDDGSYKTAYGEAEKVFKRTKNSDDLLASVWYTTARRHASVQSFRALMFPNEPYAMPCLAWKTVR